MRRSVGAGEGRARRRRDDGRGRDARVEEVADGDAGRAAAGVRDRVAAIAGRARAGVRGERLLAAHVGRVDDAVAAAQDQRAVGLEAAVGEAEARPEVVLVGLGEVAPARRVLARDDDGARRRVEVRLLVEALGRRGEDVVAQAEVQRQRRRRLPVVLDEEGDLLVRLEVGAARVAAGDEAGAVAEEEVGERRAGVVRPDAVVVARDEAAARRAVLRVGLRAAVAAAVVVRVLAHAQVAAELQGLVALDDRHGVGEVEVVREEVEGAAVARELGGAVGARQLVHDAEEDDAARRAARG